MMTSVTATLDEVFALAAKLSPDDRQRLVQRLRGQDIAGADVQTRRTRRRRYYEEAAAYGNRSPTAAEILASDRQERDVMLMGAAMNHVHD